MDTECLSRPAVRHRSIKHARFGSYCREATMSGWHSSNKCWGQGLKIRTEEFCHHRCLVGGPRCFLCFFLVSLTIPSQKALLVSSLADIFFVCVRRPSRILRDKPGPGGQRDLIRTHIKTHMCCSLGFCLFEKQLLVPFCGPRQCSSLELLGIPWGPLCFGSLGHPVAL